MFQMSKKMFNKLWPVIAAQIESDKEACPTSAAAAAAASPTIAAEAGYVLGIALGYALSPGAPTGIGLSPRRETGHDEKPRDRLPANRRPAKQYRRGSAYGTTHGNGNAQETS